MDDESITVLLVDDDEQWARYLACELEDADAGFSVTVALNVNEAVLALDDHAVDCVVTDFRMPEIDGIELLEHVRETRPDLPLILVTGDGSEDVAARAIGAGVTDYIRKDPRVDQTAVFVNRIRQAVERARLRTDVRESEHRYRTVIEQTRDAIVVLQDDEVVFTNDRFEALCDPGGASESPSALFSHVHEADRERVDELVRAAHAGDDPGLREVRLVRPTGEVRHCEILGGAISYESDAATLLSIRDVTLRRTRKRTLEREREFNQAVQKCLVGVQTRDELESEVAAVLAADGYGLVWIGSVDEGGVRTRATAGTSEYVDRLEAGTTGGDHGGDPILWSARTGGAQFVPDFEALMPTRQRNDALDSGFRTGCALPLCHDDISYGSLAVYHAEPYQLDDVERKLLTEVAATVSFAIHHVETRQSLTSAERVVVAVEIESDSYYLPQLLAERFGPSTVEVTVDGTHAVDGDSHVQYLSCSADDPDAVADALGDHPSVRSRQLLDSGDPVRYQVTVDAETPESHLGAVGALVRSTTATPGRASVTFELASRTALQPAIDRLNAAYGSVTVRSVVERTGAPTRDKHARVDIESLTAKQLAALEAAYHQGYFDRPRQRSAVDIAKSLGITHTTYLQHLRVAQRKLFGQLFGGVTEATSGRQP